jgi:hypothetical protein
VSTGKETPGTGGPLRWFENSYSSEEGDQCVGAAIDGNAVHVRDCEQIALGRSALKVGSTVWTALLETV